MYLAEYDYGVFTTKFRSFCAKYAMRKATLNLPVSNFLKSELAGLGITHTEVIPTGYDPDRFKIANKKAKVISIAQVDSAKRFKIKGVDRVLAVASLIPEISIEIIGVSPELYNAAELPDNVAVLPNLTETEIAQKLAEAKVCLILSVREGLPNIVFEAFLSGCVVVGIDHSGLAEAVGKYGYLIPEWDAQKAAGLVREVMHENDLGLKARDYVRNNFTQDHRYSKLQEVFNIVE